MSLLARNSRVLLALLMAFALMGVACGGDSGGTNTPAGGASAPADEEESPTEEVPASADFNATEYAFSAPETLPAGTTTINLINVGEEPHMLDLVAITDDAPEVAKLVKMKEKEVQQYFAGRPLHLKTVKPGEEISKEVELEPGRYAYVCFYSEKGEPPHAFKGMLGELTVE